MCSHLHLPNLGTFCHIISPSWMFFIQFFSLFFHPASQFFTDRLNYHLLHEALHNFLQLRALCGSGCSVISFTAVPQFWRLRSPRSRCLQGPSSLGLQDLSLWAQVTFSLYTWGQEIAPSVSLPKRVLIYLVYPCLLKALSVNAVTLGVGIQHMNFRRDIVQSTAQGMYSSVGHNLHNSLPPWHWLESGAIHHYRQAAVPLRAEVRGSEIVIAYLSLSNLRKYSGDWEGQECQAKWKIHILVEVNNIFTCLYANWMWLCQRMKLKAPLWNKPQEGAMPGLLSTVRSSAGSCRHLSLRSLFNSLSTPTILASTDDALPVLTIMQICRQWHEVAGAHKPPILATKS